MVAADNIVVDFKEAFYGFMHAAVDDARLGPLHISLYAAILHFYSAQEEQGPLSVFGKHLMQYAKISSNNTYHRVIQELHRYGYIHYLPSYNPVLGSLVYLLKIQHT
ncbi:hypothetical protein FRZ67_18860 [Panacibacter ginsenosidivorans]|uniref:Helix-turn-helix domain-containing protein n=1 Tax=Panacibacter ginsenosidivorans TaxID=1813871 RepID=A0A5B8VDC3_9BACT|nr:hypothetical protein [Panacibacter ginsenosidivorans]QEC69269.1 hypothetical protein FRZ67_18860 [Panacibacter ginsenosidivorans]